jgi:dTDP-4-dehydrorhamnose reductase
MLLITGASGYVGQNLLAYYAATEAAGSPAVEGGILPAWRSRALKCGVQVDLSDVDAVARLVSSHHVTAVVHLAAEARTGLCEKNPVMARAGNTDATQNLLDAVTHAATAAAEPRPLPYFLYTSTDMVFRGDNPPYSADSTPDAIAVYGRSKAKAEEHVRAYSGPWCIVRPALIYGAPCGGRVSVLDSTVHSLQTGEGAFFEDEIRTPVFVDDLVRLIAQLVVKRVTGIINAGGPDRVSRYEFAAKVARAWGIDAEVKRGRIGDDPQHAWRPRDISMVSDAAHALVGFTAMDLALGHIVRQPHTV